MLGTNSVNQAKIAALAVRMIRTLQAGLARKSPWRS